MQIWSTPAWPNFSHNPAKTEAALARVMARLGAIKGMHRALPPEARDEIFLRAITGEALASFAIEGAALPAEAIEASVVASLMHRQLAPERRSDAIAELMLEARAGQGGAGQEAAGQGGLTAEWLCHWHNLLFHGVEVEEKGRWRSFSMEIVRGASGRREDVLYTALPAERIAPEMDRFLDWLAKAQTPTPIHAALAHLWFESIHPFSDGNGRIGRAIIEYVFAVEGGLPFALSRQIEADKRGYYAALQAGRRVDGAQIDGTEFVLWLLGRIEAGIESAEREAAFLLRRNAYFLRLNAAPERGAHVLRRLFAEGQTRVEQGISAGPYAKIAATSAATATRDLADLESLGLIAKAESGGRSTFYRLNW